MAIDPKCHECMFESNCEEKPDFPYSLNFCDSYYPVMALCTSCGGEFNSLKALMTCPHEVVVEDFLKEE